MNLDNLPNQFKQLLQNRELSMNQKMVTLMAFMPDIPNMPPAENCDELGTTIKDLIKLITRMIQSSKNWATEFH